MAKQAISNQKDHMAISYLSQALAFNSDDIEAMDLIAIAHAHISEFETAITWLDKALEISPNNAGLIEHRNLMIQDWQAYNNIGSTR